MSDVASNEQWKLDGICKECRRLNYCSKQCKANKQRVKTVMFTALNKATNGFYGKVLALYEGNLDT